MNTNDSPRSYEERHGGDLAALQDPHVFPSLKVPLIFSLGKNRYAPAIPTIESFLRDPEPTVRAEAIKVLLRYYRLTRYWETARQMMLHDSSSIPQIMAASVLGDLMRDTGDARTLAVLGKQVRDATADPLVRGNAYSSMRKVYHYLPQEHSVGSRDIDDMKIDWDWVDQMIANHPDHGE